jgi:hypothetical protein
MRHIHAFGCTTYLHGPLWMLIQQVNKAAASAMYSCSYTCFNGVSHPAAHLAPLKVDSLQQRCCASALQQRSFSSAG